jgi:flagellar biosynthesis protein FlhF
MRLKLFLGKSVTEAMAQVRADLGPDALILSTRRTAEGVEVTAALDPPTQPEPPQPSPPPLTLEFHGIPTPILSRLQPRDLAGSLPNMLQFGPLPLSADGPPLLLAGPPGAGKTLSVARLATRLVLSGVKPLIITADGRRAGAAEELAAYTRLLGLSLIVASTPANLSRALARRGEGMPVVIDTAGTNPIDEGELAFIAKLSVCCAGNLVLVLPAGQDPLEAAEQATAFANIGARWLLSTRLDQTRRLGSILTAAVAGALTLTEAGIGPRATDGLTPLTPAFLAERLQLGPRTLEQAT